MIGLGTYAFFWQHSSRSPTPLGLNEMLVKSQEMGAQVFQICDYAPILKASPDQLDYLRKTAGALGITLELGTKGIQPEHLADYLRVAEALVSRSSEAWSIRRTIVRRYRRRKD